MKVRYDLEGRAIDVDCKQKWQPVIRRTRIIDGETLVDPQPMELTEELYDSQEKAMIRAHELVLTVVDKL